ncbi:hypothetical protein [Corynebacterium aurimucosum]|uniref:hypothetical protein n=1 Tax=Corynebacterium aurimucosum TaxID=169292 RepID=UPI0015E0C44C|nr:hypothetical protein [Corynebacterium aurimucosum]
MATVAGASPVAQAATVEVPVGTIAVGGFRLSRQRQKLLAVASTSPWVPVYD